MQPNRRLVCCHNVWYLVSRLSVCRLDSRYMESLGMRLIYGVCPDVTGPSYCRNEKEQLPIQGERLLRN